MKYINTNADEINGNCLHIAYDSDCKMEKNVEYVQVNINLFLLSTIAQSQNYSGLLLYFHKYF